jgi:CHAD domain-containing protein
LSFKLDPARPVSEAIQHAACSEVEAAYGAVAAPRDRHKGVHDARKCLKRLRSLLVLIRPGLPDPVFADLNRKLRTIAKGLAPARDANALFEALEKLVSKDGEGEGEAVKGLKAWLSQRKRAAETRLQDRMGVDAMQGLAGLRPTMASLAVYPDTFEPIALGLRASYREGRKAFDRAFESGDDERFHDWRKTLQQHWRQMQLLSPCQPSELSVRVEVSRTLSQVLGDDHDIAMLCRLLSAPTLIFAGHEETKRFLKRCRRRQKVLRNEAKSLGARLFSERPRPFVERIEAYWNAAALAGGSPEPKSNVVAFGQGSAPQAPGRARASG